MCEAVQQLGAHFEGRIEAIGKCRELVGDHPEEREEVLLLLNREVREVEKEASDCEERLQGWKDQLEAAERCIAWTKTWTDRQKNQENEIPTLALRKHQTSARQDGKEEQLKVKKVVTKSGSDNKKPTVPEAPKRPKATIGQVAFLTLAQFDAIPKYMKGRVTYEGVNAAVDELNVALVEKYTFLGGKMADLPNPKAKKRYQALRAQESKDTKGVHFVTSDELRDSTHLKSETGRRSLLTILRHFGLVREIRGPGSIVRFAVTKTCQ